jgi:argininosuccinate lyase
MNEQDGHLGVGDRLKTGPAPELVASAFALEAGDGPLLHHALNLADLAHVVTLIETGLIPTPAGAQLLAALLEMNTILPNQFPFDPAHGDAYTNREHFLRQKVPTVAGWIQAGRPRREATTLAYLLVTRDRLLRLAGALLNLMQSLLRVSAAHLNTLMPDYTYLQTAQPTTLAHYLLAFVPPITRDLARLQAAYERINLSPAGSGSTNGSRLPLNRRRLAKLLGFDGLAVHARDAMWQSDLPIEVMSLVVAALVNADRLAEDLQIWATAEFNFIELADGHSRVSVIMPQKKNPYSLAFVRGVARRMIGALAGVAALGATPSGQVDNRIFIYGSVPAAIEQAAQALELLAGVVAAMNVHPEVMARRAGEGFAAATDLAEVIMLEHQLDTRTAHRIVGHAIRSALEQNSPLTAVLLDKAGFEIIGQPLGMVDQAIAGVMQPEAVVATRTGPGGAASQPVRAMIETFNQTAAIYAGWQAAQQSRLQAAEENLMASARKLIK